VESAETESKYTMEMNKKQCSYFEIIRQINLRSN
jgi:hypothetical protein